MIAVAATRSVVHPLATETLELCHDWQVAAAPPGSHAAPPDPAELNWVPARVPGTAAGALAAAGLWEPGSPRDFDAEDWWFRTAFTLEPAAEGEQLMLVLEGVATVAQVYLNGTLVADSESMFTARRVDITELAVPANELAVRCLALAPLLQVPRGPRARWRTRLVNERNLRFYRTMLLGRAPGFAAGPAVVGPYRPVRIERRRGPVAERVRLRAALQGGLGHLSVTANLRVLEGGAPLRSAALEVARAGARHRVELRIDGRGREAVAAGELVIPAPELWWPHTHGTPALYESRLVLETGARPLTVPTGQIGFRALGCAGRADRDGLDLHVNGTPVFARGAVWTVADLLAPHRTREQLRPLLEAAVRAGMNMLRVAGISAYESDAFYDLCDELGILVWQDFMFANFDYPDRDPDFLERVRAEARELLERLGQRPSLAVLCGGSEVAQQAAMVGLEPDHALGPLYLDCLPGVVAEADVQAPYLPSTPWGGDMPFRTGRGVTHYYGVGAYRRPLEDARRAEVRFAAECLAFANVPDADALAQIAARGGGEGIVHHPDWKRAVPRDRGAGWDFDDVRDHYLRLLFGVDPVALRSVDPERYLELSRQLSGEVMAEVFGEWRRAGSPCAGALVLWLKDIEPGAGWGVLDHRGRPKAAYHHLRRALAPIAVWTTDEGLDGVTVHVANDRDEPLSATLRVAMYRDGEICVEHAQRELWLAPRGIHSESVEALIGRFVDVSFAYRFGPPAQDLVVLSLEDRTGVRPRALSQAFRHPAGRPTRRESAEQLGLHATLCGDGQGALLTMRTCRFAYGVRIHVPGHEPDDDAFSLEPGHERTVPLRRRGSADEPLSGYLTALNLSGRLPMVVL